MKILGHMMLGSVMGALIGNMDVQFGDKLLLLLLSIAAMTFLTTTK